MSKASAGSMRIVQRLRTALRGDGILSLLFLLVLIAYLVAATQLRGGLMSDLVGPRTFPIMMGILGLGLCLIFFVQKLRQPGVDESADEVRSIREELWDLRLLWMLLVYVLAMTTLGYLLATFLYVTLTTRMLGQTTWRGSAIFAAGLTVTTFVLFSYAFEVRLPPGVILPSPY